VALDLIVNPVVVKLSPVLSSGKETKNLVMWQLGSRLYFRKIRTDDDGRESFVRRRKRRL